MSASIAPAGRLEAQSPVEACVDIDVPGIGLLATPLGSTTDRNVEIGLSGSKLLGKEAAVSSESFTLLLKVSSLELNATAIVHAEQREDCTKETSLLVDLVLLLSISSAKRRIEGTGECVLAHAVRLLVVELATAVLRFAAAWRRRRSGGLLIVAVGTDDDDLEAGLILTGVGSRLWLDRLSPNTALELGDGGSLARALVGVELGVTLNEDVEASAGACGVTEG